MIMIKAPALCVGTIGIYAESNSGPGVQHFKLPAGESIASPERTRRIKWHTIPGNTKKPHFQGYRLLGHGRRQRQFKLNVLRTH